MSNDLENLEEIQNVTAIELKKKWKRIKKDWNRKDQKVQIKKKKKSPNGKGEKKFKNKRKTKVQIEKEYKSPNIKWKK